ncbi:MAG: hypothetical protein V1720_15925 [bacterium]
MKIIFTLISLILSQDMYLMGQSNSAEQTQSDTNRVDSSCEKTREVFIYSSIGFLEILSVGVGYQATDNISIAVKASYSGVEGNPFPNFAVGLGIKAAYHFNQIILFINKISFEYTAHIGSSLEYEKMNIDEPFYKGTLLEFNVGRENIHKSGFGIIWSAGINMNRMVKYRDTVIVPSFKIGIFYNF